MSKGSRKSKTSLGIRTEYPQSYAPELLFPIPRSRGRQQMGLDEKDLPFHGFDIWTAYELSWLDSQGKPTAAIGEISVPCNSDNMIESKSFKLYLNSLNQQVFDSKAKVLETLENDLSSCVVGPLLIDLFSVEAYSSYGVQHLPGSCIDDTDAVINTYEPDASLLSLDDGPVVTETLHSHLLKTNCPVTGQPDWASILFRYTGSPINRESLLKYLISYRNKQDFHENCVEQIFVEVLELCQPYELEVCARYTRRGGLDINPCRSTSMEEPTRLRTARQ